MLPEEHVARRAPYGSNPEVGARALQTYDRILQASIRVFDRTGFRAARMEQVAKAARVSRAAVYQYFESKDEIVRALSDRMGNELLALVADLEPIDPTPEGGERLREWLWRLSQLTVDHAPVFDIWADYAGQRPMFADLRMSFSSRFSRELGAKLNVTDSGIDAGVMALTILGLIDTVTELSLRGEVPFSFSELVDQMAVIVHRGIFPQLNASDATATAEGRC